MPARITTIAFEGAEARRVEAEVVLTNGQVGFQVVGLGDKAVAESRERVRGAFAGGYCGVRFRHGPDLPYG